jgi:catechol 2,3-dioxygenase-like lactoylglutathione lyase family enzyme
MSTAPAISFIVVRCADIERSRAFYEATLGVVAREEQHEKGPRHYSFRLDSAILELYPRGEREIGALRFGLRVVDLTATLASAERTGGRVVRTASGDVSAVLEDPDGHKIELVQQHSSPVVHVDTSDIVDWDSFHNAFAHLFGFPDFYGRNMNAWIDCMTALDAREEGLTTVHVECGDVLTLALHGVDDFSKRCPEIFEALIDCVAFVNCRRLERGDPAVLTLSFSKTPPIVSSAT